MHEIYCKMLDIDSDTNFIYTSILTLLLWIITRGYNENLFLRIGFMENQADSGILQWGTRFSIIFLSINQYSL